MAKKKTNKEFYEKVKTRTGITEEYIHEFDYRIVSNRMLKKRKKISDFVYETNKPKSIEDVEKILTKLDSFGGRVTLEKDIFCYGIE